MTTQETKSAIYIDGEEFVRIYDDTGEEMFEEIKLGVDWKEIALMVWKPRYGVFLREKFAIR